MGQVKYYNVMIVSDGVPTPFGFRVRAWVFKAALAALVILAMLLLLFFINYGRILVRASRTERLEKENESLRIYKYKLGLLEANMKETREVVDRIAKIAGVDIELPELPPDSILFSTIDERSSEALMHRDSVTDGRPHGLPLKGYMTRGYSDDSTTYHPGIDIAAAIGTPVLATGPGNVIFAGYDSTYGLTVIIEHADNISSLYGHNSELLARPGDKVEAGTRIALSGNTGRSTAPHLHYEIREFGKSINPLKYITDDEISNKQN
jgi:murein DD-endopeptidase MepM/ murein hydrolase activator NlpD